MHSYPCPLSSFTQLPALFSSPGQSFTHRVLAASASMHRRTPAQPDSLPDMHTGLVAAALHSLTLVHSLNSAIFTHLWVLLNPTGMHGARYSQAQGAKTSLVGWMAHRSSAAIFSQWARPCQCTPSMSMASSLAEGERRGGKEESGGGRGGGAKKRGRGCAGGGGRNAAPLPTLHW